jgi:antitoxin component YwqK of YwqJK toxin-antitoxin module
MKMLMKKLLKGVIALTVLAGILITVQISVDRNPFESLTTVVLVYLAAAGILLSFFGAAGWFVVWVVSRVARDKGAGNVGVASVSIATEGVIILVVLVVGSLWVWSWLTGGECPGGPDGPVETYYDNGQLEETWTLKDGCWDGPYEWYYENGQLRGRQTWKDGKLDGPFEWYYENGQLEWRGTWKEWALGPQLDGPYETYYENGRLREKRTWKDGKLDGPYETYHPNGQLESKRTYRDGDRDGLWETYYENGQLRNEGTYKDGEKCGEWLEDGGTVTYPPCPPDLEDGN